VPQPGERGGDESDDESEGGEKGPSGLRWVNVGELFQALEGRLLCTECGIGDLTAEPPEETQRGAGSVFRFRCEECDMHTFTLRTQAGLRLGKRGPPTSEATVRLANWALRNGGGYAAVQALCRDMDVPAPSFVAFNLALGHASRAFKQAGEELMEEACNEERALLVSQGVESDANGALATKVTFDGSWPKRYGHNSLWGFTSMRSRLTRKILGTALKFKVCATCDVAARKRDKNPNYVTPPHDCTLEPDLDHRDQSAKSMETEGGIRLIKVLHEKAKLRIGGLIGDADSSLMAKIAELPEHLRQVEKELDVGHVKGNLYSALRAMDGGVLSDPVVNYLTYGFGCCVYQCGGDAQKLIAAAVQGVDHAFNRNHDRCGDWCKAKSDPNYKPKLPGCKWLSGDELHGKVRNIFAKYVSDNNAEKLKNAESSNHQEALHSGLWGVQLPKTKHFTASVQPRVMDRVAQTNAGSRKQASMRQNALLGLETGVHELHGLSLATQRAGKEAARKKTPQYKLSRQKNRMIRKQGIWREKGSSDYATGQELDSDSAPAEPEAVTPTDQIPPTVISTLPPKGVAVMIDLEHGGMAKGESIADPDIIQLALTISKFEITRDGKLKSEQLGKLSSYVHSARNISTFLQNKLRIKPSWHPRSPLRHAPKLRAVADDVASLLQEHRKQAGLSLPVVFMAHNGFSCDAPVLYWNLQRRGIDAYGWFKKLGVDRWFDTLEFARLVRGEKKGNSVEELYRSEVDATGGGLTFHDALDDCLATWQVLESSKFQAGMSKPVWLAKSVLSIQSLTLKIRAAKEKKDAQPAAEGGGTRKRKSCSICGQVGHTKPKCPKRAGQ
jgi:hypothetical protein